MVQLQGGEVRDQKKHNRVRGGRKFQKKERIRKLKLGISEEQQKADFKNIKAESHRSSKEKKRVLDLSHTYARRIHKTRTYEEPPPKVVCVIGGKNSGKSTVIKSLIKHYTRKNIEGEVNGPVTVRAGKGRITLIDPPTRDMNALLDIGKVVDLVLICIDVTYGIEMEVFEFLNIIQVHGFPRVMGVFTHMDLVKENKSGKKKKRLIKRRFRKEINEQAKIFTFAGLRNGLYTPRETMNLAKFISTKKPKEQKWRVEHPSILVDRYEDVTKRELLLTQDPTLVKRHIFFYGYVRGTNFKQKQMVHIPGMGDFQTTSISSMPDPLPPSEKKSNKVTGKHRGIYAPMTNVGDLIYDKDAVYLQMIRNSKTQQNNIINDVKKEHKFMDDKLKSSSLQLLKGGKSLNITEAQDYILNDDDNESKLDLERYGERVEDADDHDEEEINESQSNRMDDDFDEDREYAEMDKARMRKSLYGNANDDFMSDDKDIQKRVKKQEWKEQMEERAAEKFFNRLNWNQLIYHSSEDIDDLFEDKMEGKNIPKQSSDEISNIFSMAKTPVKKTIVSDVTLVSSKIGDLKSYWSDEENIELLRSKFVTGNWEENTDEEHRAGFELVDDAEDPENQPYSDTDSDSDSDSDSDDNMEDDSDMDEETLQMQRIQKKQSFDEKFDKGQLEKEEEEDVEEAEPQFKTVHELIQHQKALAEDPQDKLNRIAFSQMDKHTREQIEGFIPGTYIRIEIEDVNPEFMTLFNPKRPILVGGLKPDETQMGFIKLRLKKHRWFSRTLKNKDPLIFSIGWRRYQSLPIYCTRDVNGRHRMLKYTPDHMHCIAVIYGPMVPQNTGVVAFQTFESDKEFSIAATGYSMESDSNMTVVKKLKLTGYPREIKKNSCFVTQMFSSALEVAKFEGARLRTVSGIRGQLKKAILTGRQGDFRATFEDRILPSDIVFLRTWYPIELPQFFNPVNNLLTKSWIRMRLVREIRADRGLAIPQKEDSRMVAELAQRNETGHHLLDGGKHSLTSRMTANVHKNLPFSAQKKKEIHVEGLTRNLISDALVSSRPNLAHAIKSEKDRRKENFINRIKAIDAHRRVEQRAAQTKQALEHAKTVVQEARIERRRKRKSKKLDQIQQQQYRAKRARYSINDGSHP
mmetsp:Transcript_3220/g.4756  ORF Transcript_3220/g.4756 Transcript_3220/m.4756 type:complete len:1141 (-) Transcript_3220:33-3455(-)